MLKPSITLSLNYNKGIYHLYIIMQTTKNVSTHYVLKFLFDQ